MNTIPSSQLPSSKPVDKDLHEQAHPGHGIPSQDPNPAAQSQLNPEESQHEAESALVGGGVVAGAAAGAAIGVMVAGPVGVVVGTTLGAVAGAMGGAAAATTADPQALIQPVKKPPERSALEDPGR
jgi:hypothetical protein